MDIDESEEAKLWRAVVEQAFRDGLSNKITSNRSFEDIRSARHFLFEDEDDFIAVCLCADYCPLTVRKFARKLFERKGIPCQLK